MSRLASFLATAALVPACAWADIHAYVALPLTATQETDVVASNGNGSVTVLYDTTTKVLMYNIVYTLHPGSTATAAHFHGPAGLGGNAGVQIGLPTQPTGNSGRLSGSVTLTAEQETQLMAGNWYFNIHSSLAGAGELRAQLIDNSSSVVLPTFNAATLKLTLPVVLVPGFAKGSYNAELTYTGGTTGNAFELTAAEPFR